MKIKLENKDCFLFLKTVEDNSVDLVLIDPTYIISRDTGFTNRNFIVCEIDKSYYDKSLERIKKYETRSKDTD